MQGDVGALLRGVVAVEALEVDPEVEQQRLGVGVELGIGIGVGLGLRLRLRLRLRPYISPRPHRGRP